MLCHVGSAASPAGIVCPRRLDSDCCPVLVELPLTLFVTLPVCYIACPRKLRLLVELPLSAMLSVFYCRKGVFTSVKRLTDSCQINFEVIDASSLYWHRPIPPAMARLDLQTRSRVVRLKEEGHAYKSIQESLREEGFTVTIKTLFLLVTKYRQSLSVEDRQRSSVQRILGHEHYKLIDDANTQDLARRRF